MIMKIGIIVRKLVAQGGTQRQALSLARYLANSGHEVTLYTLSYDISCFPDLIGSIKVVELAKHMQVHSSWFFGPLADLKTAYNLALLIDPDTDVLNPHDAKCHHVSYFAKRKFEIPSVWYMNEFPNMRWPVEIIDYVEDSAYHDIPYRPYFIKKAFMVIKTLFENFFIRAQDRILVLSTYHKNLLSRYSKVNATVVPSGVDGDRFPLFEKHAPERGARIELLSSGIFLPYRRFEDCIGALALLVERGYDAHLSILGDHATDKKYYEKLNLLVDSLGMRLRVKFYGKYSDSELREFFEKSHFFLFPHFQSQGLSAYEAIVSGLPTIVTSLLGTFETIENGITGVIVPPKDPESIARVIEELIEKPQLYRKISRDGADIIRRKFSWDRYAKECLAVFEEVSKIRYRL